jgi:hypothetical protein
MLRAALLAGILLAACGGSHAGGPAWPKAHATESDGGESLAPQKASAVAAIEEAEDTTPSVSAAVTPSAPAASTPAVKAEKSEKPATPESSPSTDEILTTEEIIIEIDD